MYNIHLHITFQESIQKTLKKYRSESLEKRLYAELDKLCDGPRRNAHRSLRGVGDLGQQVVLRRARLRHFRLIFLVDTQQQRIFPLYLSPRPRNGYSYENMGELVELAEDFLNDFAARRYDRFARWACE